MATKKPKEPTLTSLVEEALAASDDFMTTAMVLEATKMNRHQAEVTLHHLKNYKAISAMESDGKLWWYATPDTDTRIRHVEERVPEEAGSRRKRKPRLLPLAGITTTRLGSSGDDT